MFKSFTLLFLGSLLLFIAVLPGNHSEAEDAFQYSRLIEEGRGAELFHPHHLLYLPIQKSLYHTAQALGYDGRSYYTARAVSMFGGAMALCLFYWITCRLQLLKRGVSDGHLSLLSTLGLLFSYGFVRYACEVEIYLPALAMALAAVYAALRARDAQAWFVAGIVFASLAVLMHTINVALSLVIIPLFYLWVSNDRKQAALHAVGTLAVVGVAYWVIQNSWGTYHPPVDTASEGWLRAGMVGKAVVGFGQCLLSANFVFAYEAAAEKLQAVFPYRVFSEEIFAASHMPHWLKAIAPVTFLAALAGLIAAAGFLLSSALRHRVFDRMLFVLLLWMGGTMLPTVILEPSNPELWILVLAPLWAVFLWVTVLVKPSGRTMRLLWLMVCLFGMHNLVTGMGCVKDRDSDYNVKKGEWILLHANEDDVVNTADSYVFTFYLNYWGKADVQNVNSHDWKAGETTYVFDDVFSPPAAVGVRYPEFAQKVKAVALELRPRCRKIHENQFGGIWIVDEGEPK